MSTPEKFVIDEDITVVCIQASSFPEGIQAAWEKLFSAIPSREQRKLYGISFGDENGKIIYKAAAEELHKGEAEKLNLETFVVRKGEYISELLEDWRKDETQIGSVFRKLLDDPRVDRKEGYCVELYFNATDVRCMLKLDGSANKN